MPAFEIFDREITSVILNSFLSFGCLRRSYKLQVIANDKGISRKYITALLNDRHFQLEMVNNFKAYLKVMAYYSWGAGVCTILEQQKMRTPFDLMTIEQGNQIVKSLLAEGPINKAFIALGRESELNTKNPIDRAVNTAVDALFLNYSDELLDETYIRRMMQVFFNVGITMALE